MIANVDERARQLRLCSIASFEILDPALRKLAESTSSHIYVHLTDSCSVECPHCMYASRYHAEPQAIKGRLLERLLKYLREASPEKLTISGGGEPFEEGESLLAILRNTHGMGIEIDTSAVWAKDNQVVRHVLDDLNDAALESGSHIVLRLSVDSFHISTNRVSLQAYARVVNQWLIMGISHVDVALRGLALEGDRTLERFAELLGSRLEMTSAYHGQIRVQGKVIPVAKNVMRFSGRGVRYRDSLAVGTPSVNEYYSAYLDKDVRLGLVVNDAVGDSYRQVGLPAVTVNYDGSAYIFSSTPPDRRPNIADFDYSDSLRFLLQDPIVVYLLLHPLDDFLKLASSIDSKHVLRCVAENDYCLIIEKLLSDDLLEALVSAECLLHLLKEGSITLDGLSVSHVKELLEEFLGRRYELF